MRWTFLVLIGAIMKGATQLLVAGSSRGLRSSGWAGPWKPGVSEKGSRIRASTTGSRAAAAVAPALAAVPPEKVPRIARTRPWTWPSGAPKRSTARSWRKRTPRSKGIESKPLENRMRAPEAWAAA